MSIYIWDKEIKDLCIWDSNAKEVYLWDTKVRPTQWKPLFIDDDYMAWITRTDWWWFSLAERISGENRFRTCDWQDYENWLYCIFNYDLATYIYNLNDLSNQDIGLLWIWRIDDIELEDDSEIEEGIEQADYFIRIKYETDSYIIYNTNDIQLYGEWELNWNLIKECEEWFSNLIIAVSVS